MTQKEKMMALIEKKKQNGHNQQKTVAKNDRKNMRKGPKIFNK
ncbi:30S ribosomal protein S9 [Levilactobacillus namurensis]|uniref:30S ribosomal protein S9 n=1 Tax=Levilactobacillus namurensis TaxID=380393 RepID=A0AAW8W6V5_9LACO|nr:hypothetical protein [Levilactobacillus namurensis]MCW3777316.1 hypothetical protein [Levilactobacillus namurensis]MDT7014452.1 hypothetical protein [Levilactobacillus namurensis]MDT7018618.1 hypothetical protein [Levilactobacillus namurensis]WNN64403.1 hypothetical protein RIN67_06700 [Levilactobacillus namurensis]GEO73580.1 30S ribosomal protein S9 [Levilactobacillus namurensis]